MIYCLLLFKGWANEPITLIMNNVKPVIMSFCFSWFQPLTINADHCVEDEDDGNSYEDDEDDSRHIVDDDDDDDDDERLLMMRMTTMM